MIAVPWFKFPWTTATADTAHAMVTDAKDGDASAQGILDEIKKHAAEGNKIAQQSWRYFAAIIKLVDAGQPPPSVILQMRAKRAAVGFNGGFPGGIPMLPWGYQSAWNYGSDPFVFEGWSGDAEVGQNPAGFQMMFNPPSWPSAVGEPLPGEIEYEYEVGQAPPGLNFGMGPLPGVPLMPFGMGPFNYGPGAGEYMRGGPGMSEDIELEDRYV